MARQHAELEVGGVWRDLSATTYDDAVYGSPLLRPVLDAELRLARELLTPGSVLVEVGCGTGQFCRRLVGDAKAVVGVDISSGMLEELARCAGDAVVLVEGDARHLAVLLAETPVVAGLIGPETPVVAACVMNTLGIMGEATPLAVLEQMARQSSPLLIGISSFVLASQCGRSTVTPPGAAEEGTAATKGPGEWSGTAPQGASAGIWSERSETSVRHCA